MYQHLMVAVDGSLTAEHALEHAIALAESLNADITMIHVANPTEYIALNPEFLHHDHYSEAAIIEGNKILDLLTEKAKQALPDHTIHRHLLEVDQGGKEMAKALVKYADAQGVDLIILGTHGRSGLMHLLLGSFAETVMKETHLPLLVIRGEEKAEE